MIDVSSIITMLYSHCPKCGTQYTTLRDTTAPQCSFCKFTFYFNSKPTSSVLIVNDKDEVLLGKRRIEPSKGKWDVIGGFLNFGEHPEDGAIREAKEETGYDIEIQSILGFFMDIYQPTSDATLNICFIAKSISGEPFPEDDIEELKWFSMDEIPGDIAFKNGRDMIDAYRLKIK